MPRASASKFASMICKAWLVPGLLATACLAQTPAPQPKPLKPGLYAIFDTSEGTFTAELYDKYTKRSVATFVGLAKGTLAWLDPRTRKLVRRPLYDGITFHRVVRYEMIQAGDPTGIGNHNCGFTIRDEYLPGLRFDRPGRLAMANVGRPDSAGCQFFVTDQAISRWDNNYTIFGQVVTGMEVVHAINRKPLVGEKPTNPVLLNHVSIIRITRMEDTPPQ